jgi:hypothetical protein
MTFNVKQTTSTSANTSASTNIAANTTVQPAPKVTPQFLHIKGNHVHNFIVPTKFENGKVSGYQVRINGSNA